VCVCVCVCVCEHDEKYTGTLLHRHAAVPDFVNVEGKIVQNGSGAHPASYLKGTGGSFPGGKAAGA
jgi:hypothetical protein